MNKRVSAVLLLALCAITASAQLNLASIRGRATDEQGQPIANAEIRMAEADTGRKYTLKTDKNGNYQSIAIQPGRYKITLWKEREIYNLNNVGVTLSNPDNVVDFDLKKERQLAAKSGTAPQLTAEQKAEIEKINKENLTIKDLNNMLAQARAAKEAGDTDSAAATVDKALALDANRDLLWYTKGDIQIAVAKKETDRAAKKQKYAEAAVTLQKAVDLANASVDPKSKALLGSYYEGLAKAYDGAGDVDKSAAAYETAAKTFLALTPPNTKQAAAEYFNVGAVYTNANRADDAIKAFDKATEIDPEKADAYYYKGIALMGKGETKDGKFTAPPGTDDAFNKYLELSPEGALAEPAKQMLAAIGSEVKTSFKAKRDKKK